MPISATDEGKRRAAEYVVTLVEAGMVVGLGAGTTAALAVQALAARAIRDLRCVACSREVEEQARALGLPIVSLDDVPGIDLTIDGADEVDPQLELVKGAGGALLREKIVAQASAREVIVVDAGKLSPRLGTRMALPVEVVEFGWRAQLRFLESLDATVSLRLRADGTPFRTDQGNRILDSRFRAIADPVGLSRVLDGRAGVAAHGLFLGLATDLVIGGPDGVRHVRRGER